MDKFEALRLADELEAPVGTQSTYSAMQQAAAELRRLHTENAALNLAVARLQQHHATAWNRGHTMGMKANEDTARRALDAVKQDAWGNTMLTDALLKAEAQRDALLKAYRKMKNVAAGYSNYCDDNGNTRRLEREFEEADSIARAAIAAVEGEQK